MAKSYLAASLLALSTIACSNHAASISPAEKPVVSADLKEIQVPDPIAKYNFYWNMMFGFENFKDPNTGNMLQVIADRVAVFSSAAAFQADVEKQLGMMPEDQADAETKATLTAAVTQAYSEKVDFNTQDLVITYLTAGAPSFGGYYGYQSVGKNHWEFCLQAPANSGGTYMALQSEFKIYTAPKGTQVSKCTKK